MLRTLIAATLLAATLIAAHVNGAPGELSPLEVKQTGAAKAQECRTATTASTTKTTSPGFTSETSTTCRFDKAANNSTCTNKYKDSFKTGTTTVSVTTYAKLEDVIDEIKVNPPRRRSLRGWAGERSEFVVLGSAFWVRSSGFGVRRVQRSPFTSAFSSQHSELPFSVSRSSDYAWS